MNTEEQKKKRKKTLVVISAVLCGVLLVGCLGCFAIGSLTPGAAPTSTPHPFPLLATMESLPTQIYVPELVTTEANATNEAEIYAIQTLTAIPTATSTPTPTLTSTPFPTYTPYPTQTPFPTNTSWPTPLSQPTAVPTNPPPPSPVCDCSYNRYNCPNFSTQRQAQACYNYCLSIGAGDVHRLDADNDGRACESLP